MITRCEACSAGWQEGAGAKQPLDAADLARAECDAQRIGADQRATQDVPPKTVRFVRRRDSGRCCVPGCRSSRYLEIHHVVPREAGGNHAPDNLTLLCDGHHRAHHEGKLSISGNAPKLEFCWRDSTHGGHVRDAELALITLGFRVHEARESVAAASKSLEPGATLDAILRAALRRLAPSEQRNMYIDRRGAIARG